MKIEIDGEMIYDKVTGKTICNIEEIDNLEQAKEIISTLIEEVEDLLLNRSNLIDEKEELKQEIEMIMDNK